jgi:hypothetical protein
VLVVILRRQWLPADRSVFSTALFTTVNAGIRSDLAGLVERVEIRVLRLSKVIGVLVVRHLGNISLSPPQWPGIIPHRHHQIAEFTLTGEVRRSLLRSRHGVLNIAAGDRQQPLDLLRRPLLPTAWGDSRCHARGAGRSLPSLSAVPSRLRVHTPSSRRDLCFPPVVVHRGLGEFTHHRDAALARPFATGNNLSRIQLCRRRKLENL